MANYSKITVDIDNYATIPVDSVFAISFHNEDGEFFADTALELKNTLTLPNHFARGVNNQQTAELFAEAFLYAYGPSGVLEQIPVSVTTEIGEGSEWLVIIEMTEYGWDYIEGWFPAIDGISFLTVNEVLPEVPVVPFAVTFQIQEADGNKCTHVKIRVTAGSDFAPFWILPNVSPGMAPIYAETVADLFFDFPRYSIGQRGALVFTDYGLETQQSASFFIPLIRNYLIASVDVEPSLSGATAAIIRSHNGVGVAFDSEYSYGVADQQFLVPWQSSPIFTDLAPGNYEAYMRDPYGCFQLTTFTVPDITEFRPEPFLEISETNPLRFVKEDLPEFRNIDNSLMRDLKIPNIDQRFYRQPFLIGSVVATQIKTNYRDLVVNVYDCDGEIVDIITPELKVQNTGLTDKRDCYIKQGNDNNTFIAFVNGNIYDPETDDVINDYNTFGQLPQFAQLGMLVELDSTSVQGTFQVTGIVYDESIDHWVLVIDLDYPGTIPENGTCLSRFNFEDYDIYEFQFTQNKGQFHAVLTANDDDTRYIEQVWESEPFYFDEFDNVVTIDYSANDNQAGIDYSSGIVFRLSFPGRFGELVPQGDDEDFQDDNGNRVIQKAVYVRGIQLSGSLMPWYLAEKIIIASGHPNLKINGIAVVAVEKPEIESKFANNNPFYLIEGVFEQKKQTLITDNRGIVSAEQYALGINDDIAIGV